jgi:hypothetical protein
MLIGRIVCDRRSASTQTKKTKESCIKEVLTVRGTRAATTHAYLMKFWWKSIIFRCVLISFLIFSRSLVKTPMRYSLVLLSLSCYVRLLRGFALQCQVTIQRSYVINGRRWWCAFDTTTEYIMFPLPLLFIIKNPQKYISI